MSSSPTFLENIINYVYNAVAILASFELFHDSCSFGVRIANMAPEILSEEEGKAADILYNDLEINVNSPAATFLIPFRSTAALTVSQHSPTTHINVPHPK
jgi:hypothetical protein